mmetsp:Transcript_16153/g.24517  ORF Transcript_16153/g.24517 Transcript_16153/m.24517 type:complete len:184 (+) Transcript_16153:2-553(+)
MECRSPAPARDLASSPSRAALHPSWPTSRNIVSTPKAITRVKTMSLNSSTDGDDGDNQAEIAALEERLRQLKNKEEAAVSTTDDAVDEPVSAAPLDEDELMLEGESDDSVMFSERWKEAKDDYQIKQQESNMGGIAKVGAGLALVILLGLFSQVPVGEESLQKYQDVKGSSSRIDLGDLNPDQ